MKSEMKIYSSKATNLNFKNKKKLGCPRKGLEATWLVSLRNFKSEILNFEFDLTF